MIPSRTRGLLEMHLAAVLFGGTALFSKWIALPPIHITLWRSLAAVLALTAVQRLMGKPLRLDRRIDYVQQMGLGCLLGLHWWTYFASMQVSTVAIGLTSLFTAPVLTALLEPLVARTRLRAADVWLGLGVLAGVYLLVPRFSWADAGLRGVVFGVISAVFLSLRNIFHRQAQQDYAGIHLLIYQVLGVIGLFVGLYLLDPLPVSAADAGKLALLGILFTAVPHTLITVALRHMPARTVILITSLMLVYGILFAWLLQGATPALRTLAGGAIIVTCALIENRRASLAAAPVAPPPSVSC